MLQVAKVIRVMVNMIKNIFCMKVKVTSEQLPFNRQIKYLDKRRGITM